MGENPGGIVRVKAEEVLAIVGHIGKGSGGPVWVHLTAHHALGHKWVWRGRQEREVA